MFNGEKVPYSMENRFHFIKSAMIHLTEFHMVCKKTIAVVKEIMACGMANLFQLTKFAMVLRK